MPSLLPPLQSLNPTAPPPPSSSMKLRSASHPPRPPPRAISIFNSIFPFKLKFLGFSARPRKAYARIRKPSSRIPVLSRGEFPPGSFGGRVGQGKSLVEDEDDDDDDDDVGLSRKGDDLSNVRVRDRDRSNGFSMSSAKRRRDSGYEGFSIGNRKISQNLDGSLPRNSKNSRSLDRDSEGQKKEFGSRDGFSRPVKRGGGGYDLNFGQVGKGKGLGRQAVQVLEDVDDDDDDDDEDGKGGMLSNREGFDKEVFEGAGSTDELARSRASEGSAESYLSQSR